MSIKNFFSRKKETVARQLSHPKALHKGDIIECSLLPQKLLSQAKLEVTHVSAYDFDGKLNPCFTLKDASNNKIYLSIDEQDSLSFSIDCSQQQITQLFDDEEFAHIFDEGIGHMVQPQQQVAAVENWLVAHYKKVTDARLGYYHEDYAPLSKKTSEAEGFDYYHLLNDTDSHAIEVEVYDGGETEVCLTVYHPLRAISSMWPSAVAS